MTKRMSKPGIILVCLSSILVALAGCADDSAPGPGTGGEPTLSTGRGAISGLLVDDRFRPIHLTDDPVTEFQSKGFILLQETGRRVQTTENGEFSFSDLEPGTYTLRATVTGHEASPTRVAVKEGEFAETSVVARRVSSEGGAIITEHYAAFTPCYLHFIVLSQARDCTLDQSGESFRFDTRPNWKVHGDDLTWVVAEVQFNQQATNGEAFDITIRDLANPLEVDYTSGVIFEGDYMRLHLVNGGLTPDEPPLGADHHWWNNTVDIQMAMFGRGALAEEVRGTYKPINDIMVENTPCEPVVGCANHASMRRGVGVQFALEAQFLVSLFLGEPEVDPLAYCVLCT